MKGSPQKVRSLLGNEGGSLEEFEVCEEMKWESSDDESIRGMKGSPLELRSPSGNEMGVL